MDATLRSDTATARGGSAKFDDAAVNLPANSKPPVQKLVDSLVWGVYRNALVTAVVWLVLVGLAFFALSMAATRVRQTAAPLGRLPEFVTPGGADGSDGSQTCSARSCDLQRRSTSQVC